MNGEVMEIPIVWVGLALWVVGVLTILVLKHDLNKLERQRALAGGWSGDAVVTLQTALDNANACVALWSERALTSEKVKDELLHACLLVTENAPLIAAWIKENDPGAFNQIKSAIAKAQP